MSKFPDRFITAAFLGNAFFAAYVALFHLNFEQVDLAGHFWSAVQLSRGLFHSFSDQIFLGYVTGLFYPPLEDFVLAIGLKLGGSDSFLVFRLYLAILAAFYLASCWRVVRTIDSKWVRLGLALVLLFLINLEKSDLLKLQGLSLIDLFVTGLSSEILSFSIFLLLLKSFYSKNAPEPRLQSALLALTLLSHIVIGLAALLWFTIQIFLGQNRKRHTLVLLLGLSLSAFYLVPFIAHKGYASPSTIAPYAPWFAFVLAIVGSAISLAADRFRSASLFVTSACLLATVTLVPSVAWLRDLPPQFHYYRFTIVAYFLLALGLAMFIDSQWKNVSIKLVRRHAFAGLALALGFLFHLGSDSRPQDYDFSWPSFQPTQVHYPAEEALRFSEFGRYLVFGSDRTVDTGLDSILAARFPEFRSSKGLFWESSRTNNLQSSFLATLLAPPVVLDSFFYGFENCDLHRCLMDQTFRYYNVLGVIGNPELMTFLPTNVRSCFQDIFKNGTDFFHFQPTGQIQVSKSVFSIYSLKLKEAKVLPADFTLSAVESIERKHIHAEDPTMRGPYALSAKKAFSQCFRKDVGGLDITVQNADWSRLEEWFVQTERQKINPDLSTRPRLTKISNDDFFIEVPDDQLRIYAVKLSPLPGVGAETPSGEALPLIESYPYTLVLSRGDFHLRYGRTISMNLGLIVSLIATFGLAATFFRTTPPADHSQT